MVEFYLKMAKKPFVNQFKNTRRQAGLLGRRPPGGKIPLQFRKDRKAKGFLKSQPLGSKPAAKE